MILELYCLCCLAETLTEFDMEDRFCSFFLTMTVIIAYNVLQCRFSITKLKIKQLKSIKTIFNNYSNNNLRKRIKTQSQLSLTRRCFNLS